MAVSKDKLQKKASKLASAGKYEQAANTLEPIIEENPNDINVLNKIGDFYSRAGKIRNAISNFQTIAKHYAKEGFYAKSIAVYKKITKIEPDNTSAYYQLAELYEKEGIPNEAREALVSAAEIFIKRGKTQPAREAYEKVLSKQPDAIKVRIKLAEIYEKSRDTELAVVEYKKIGEMLLEKNIDREAQSVYEKILSFKSDDLESANYLAELYTRTGDNKKAINIYRKMLEKDPENVEVLKSLGKTYYEINAVDKAYEIIQRVLGMSPDEPETLTIMAKISLQRDDFDDAFIFSSRVIDLQYKDGPDNTTADLLKPILEKDPYHIKTLEKLISIYTIVSDQNSAITIYEKLGMAYRQNNMLDKAMEAYSKVLDFNPDNKKAQIAINELNKLQIESIPQDKEMAEAAGGGDDVIAIKDVDFGLPEAAPDLAPRKEFQPSGLSDQQEAAGAPAVGIEQVQVEDPEELKEEKLTLDPKTPMAEAEDGKSVLTYDQIYEIEIYIKYGLLDKAKGILQELEKKFSDHKDVRRLLRGIYLEQGDMLNASLEAMKLAVILKEEDPAGAEKAREESIAAFQDLHSEGAELPPEALAMIGEGAVAAPSESALDDRQAVMETVLDTVQSDEVVEEEIPQISIEPEIELHPVDDETAVEPSDTEEPVSEEAVETTPEMGLEAVVEEEISPVEIVAEPEEITITPAIDYVDEVKTENGDAISIDVGVSAGSDIKEIEIESEIEDILVDSITPVDEPATLFPTQSDSKSELKIDDLFSAIASDKKMESPPPEPVQSAVIDVSPVEMEVAGSDKELEPSVVQSEEISDIDMQDILSGGETAQPDDLGDAELAEFFDSSVIIDDDKDLMFELEEVDFYLDQVFLEEAKSKLAELQQKFPDSEGVKERLKKLAEMAAKSEIKQLHDEIIDLRGVFDDEPVHIEPVSDLDAEIDEFFAGGKPMDAKHERSLEPIEKSTAISSDSDLFGEEEDFFNVTSEIEDEFSIPEPTTNLNLEAQLESIFDEFREEVNEQLSEEDYETRYNLGIAYKEMDLIDEAIHEFQSAVKSNDYIVEASSMLGYCFMEKEMAQQAIQWFSKALQNMPVNSDQENVLGLKLTLAQAFINNNDKEKAGQMVEDISKTNPKFPGLSEIMKFL